MGGKYTRWNHDTNTNAKEALLTRSEMLCSSRVAQMNLRRSTYEHIHTLENEVRTLTISLKNAGLRGLKSGNGKKDQVPRGR